MTISGSHNTHARLSPSDSKRWTTCTASIAYQEANSHRVPKETDSAYSREGTAAHDHAANILLGLCTIEDIPASFREPVNAYVQHCLSLKPEGVSYEVEVSVPLYYQPEQSGTCDFAIVSDSRVIVRDLKYGAGVLVTSEENTQLGIYGFALVKLLEDVYDFGPDTIIDFAVFQPRHREGADQPTWTTTLAELTEFCNAIEYKAIQARTGADRVREKLPCGERDITPEEILEAAPMVKFSPEEGDEGTCRWCKCKAFCPSRLTAMMEDMDTTIDVLAELPDLTKDEKKLPAKERIERKIGNISDDELVRLFAARKNLETFLEDVTEYLSNMAASGQAIAGTKLVTGREGNRAWADEEAADKFLAGQKVTADERYTKKLVSPTQAEKLLGKDLTTRAKNRFDELVTRSDGKPVLALESDKRPAVSALVDVLPTIDD